MKPSSRKPLPCSHPPDTCPFCGARRLGGGDLLVLYDCGAKLFPRYHYTEESQDFYGVWTFAECEEEFE